MKTNDKNSTSPKAAAKPQRAKQRPHRPSLKPEAVAKRTERTLRVKIKREIMSVIRQEQAPWTKGLRVGQMPITPLTLRRLAEWLSTWNEAAAFCGVSPMTLSRRMRDNPKLREAWEEGHETGRNTLRRRQLEVAFSDAPQAATLLIHLGKTLLNQRDRVEHTGADGGPIRYNHIRRTIVDPAAPEAEREIDVSRPPPEPPKPETRH